MKYSIFLFAIMSKWFINSKHLIWSEINGKIMGTIDRQYTIVLSLLMNLVAMQNSLRPSQKHPDHYACSWCTAEYLCCVLRRCCLMNPCTDSEVDCRIPKHGECWLIQTAPKLQSMLWNCSSTMKFVCLCLPIVAAQRRRRRKLVDKSRSVNSLTTWFFINHCKWKSGLWAKSQSMKHALSSKNRENSESNLDIKRN